MELVTREQPMTRLSGSGEIVIPAGEWLNVRYGTPEEPADELLAQVPPSKQWKVLVTLSIEQTDA